MARKHLFQNKTPTLLPQVTFMMSPQLFTDWFLSNCLLRFASEMRLMRLPTRLTSSVRCVDVPNEMSDFILAMEAIGLHLTAQYCVIWVMIWTQIGVSGHPTRLLFFHIHAHVQFRMWNKTIYTSQKSSQVWVTLAPVKCVWVSEKKGKQQQEASVLSAEWWELTPQLSFWAPGKTNSRLSFRSSSMDTVEAKAFWTPDLISIISICCDSPLNSASRQKVFFPQLSTEEKNNNNNVLLSGT